MYKKTIVVGAGAAGLFFGAAAPASAGGDILILEKTDKIGTKLLMAGSGHCNLTHAGSIKEFLLCYGQNGSRIRTCLYRHNNLEYVKFMGKLGVPTAEREDGKIFPVSMDSRDVKKALLEAAAANSVTIMKNSPVTAVTVIPEGFEVTVGSKQSSYICTNLVIATGGASYPTTGSDGTFLQVLKNALGVEITELHPALSPIYVQNYPFEELSGISFKNAGLKIFNKNSSSHEAAGDLLLTHRSFSGPLILNNSRYINTGSRVEINFIFPYTVSGVLSSIKEVFRGNNKTVSSFFAEKYSLPKRFVAAVLEPPGLNERKLSSLTGGEMEAAARAFAAADYSVSGVGSFREAMATSGGVCLDSVNLSAMESKTYKGLYFIGEVLDIDGNSGGYNLQFAYSSARAALDAIYT